VAHDGANLIPRDGVSRLFYLLCKMINLDKCRRASYMPFIQEVDAIRISGRFRAH